MVKKKEEVKVQVEELHECACGGDCKCKKGARFTKLLIFALISFLLFFAGLMTAVYVLFNDKESGVDNNCPSTDSNVATEATIDVELYDENSTGYKDLSLNSETIQDFIQTVDGLNDDWMRIAFLENTELINDFKIAYVISNFCSDGCGTIYMSYDFLNSEIQKVFSTGIDTSGSGSLYLNAVEINYVCDKELCMFSAVAGGGAGYSHSVTEIASSRKEGDNTIYTLKEFDYIFDEENSYLEANGVYLCKASDCPEDFIGTYGDKMTTYEMTFDKDNRYVSSKKIK